MSAGALVSKLLGLAREVLLARFYGTGLVADAYRGSLTLALSPVHLLTTHTVQTCFIPLYTRLRSEAPERAAALFQALLIFFVGLSLLLGTALFAGAGLLTPWLLPGFDPDRQALTAQMLRIMAIGLPFYIYCVLLGALGAGRRDFTLPILRPAAQNLGLVALILVAAATGRPVLAAYGFTATYVLLAAASSWLYRTRGHWPHAWHVGHAGVSSLARLFFEPLRPLLLLSVLVQGMILIERYLSSLIGGGTVAAMDYARFVTESAHSLLLMPLGLVSLARFAHPPEGDARSTSEETADRILGLVLLVLVPVSAFLLLAGGDLVSVLYQRGAYDAESQRMTHQALLGLSCGLWAIGGAYFLRNVLHARSENATVLRYEALGACVNLAFILLTYQRLGILSLGLGLSVGATVSLVAYVRRLGLLELRTPRRFALLLAGASLYGLLGLGLHRLFGSGGQPASWVRLGSDLALFILFWGLWCAGIGELRGLAREGWRPGKHPPPGTPTGTDAPRTPIICFASSDFESGQWVNAQHLMWRLAARRRVLYVNSLGLRAPRADRRDLTKIARRLRGLARLSHQPDPDRDLHVLSPVTLPPRPGRRWQRAAARLLAWRLRQATARLEMHDPLCWVFLPTAEPVLEVLGLRRIVYHCVDAYEANPGVDAELIRALEKRLLARAERVIATSRPLYERLRATHPSVWLMPNVADLSLFPPPGSDPAHRPAEPSDLAAIPAPRLLYVGNLAAYKCDLERIVATARRRPAWSWVFVGPLGLGEQTTALDALRATPNIHLLGPRDRRQLAGYIHHCDAGLIPFRISESTRHSFPMKFFEYLACGRPVVCADLPSLREHMAPGIAFAYGDGDGANLPMMEEAIEGALGATDPRWADRRRTLAEAHSWERRMTEIETLLTEWTEASSADR